MVGTMIGMVRNTTRKLWRRQDGVAAVEFALVLPVLLLLLFGIVQFGSVVFTQNNMVNAAREGARRIAAADANNQQAEALMRQMLGNRMNFAYSFPSGTSSRDVVVRITVPATEARLVGFPGFFATGDLVATVTMRREGDI